MTPCPPEHQQLNTAFPWPEGHQKINKSTPTNARTAASPLFLRNYLIRPLIGIKSWISIHSLLIFCQRHLQGKMNVAATDWNQNHNTQQSMDKLMLCFVITTSLPLTSNTKENYKLWNKPVNQNYVNLKDFIRCISIKIKGQDLLTVARWEILIANTKIHQLDV